MVMGIVGPVKCYNTTSASGAQVEEIEIFLIGAVALRVVEVV